MPPGRGGSLQRAQLRRPCPVQRRSCPALTDSRPSRRPHPRLHPIDQKRLGTTRQPRSSMHITPLSHMPRRKCPQPWWVIGHHRQGMSASLRRACLRPGQCQRLTAPADTLLCQLDRCTHMQSTQAKAQDKRIKCLSKLQHTCMLQAYVGSISTTPASSSSTSEHSCTTTP